MKTFIYKGQTRSHVAGISLIPGEGIELPEEDRHVKSLHAQGLLEEVKKQQEIFIKPKKTKE